MEGKRTITKSVRLLLRPIARLLIELGFSFRGFNEVAKTVFVEVASEGYGIRGRPTNTSRVAIMTGLTRREVARLRNVIDHDPLETPPPTTVVGSVLSAWHHDSLYLDDHDNPIPLSVDGPRSLCNLINKYRGDIPTTAVFKELERVNAISIRGKIAYVKARYYMPFELDERAIERFGSVIHDVGDAITSNLRSSDTSTTRFEGRATNDRISVHSYEAFRKFLDRRAQAFLEEVDDWLGDHEEDASDTDAMRVGIGVYTIVD